MAMRQLQNLPPELQSLIVSWLLRPSHLKNVGLSCKVLRDIATPFLYEKVCINADSITPEALRALWVPGHYGHKVVRSLQLREEAEQEEKKAEKVAKAALRVLPQERLTGLCCGLDSNIDAELLLLLTSCQRKISNLYLRPCNKDALPLPRALTPWPPRVSALRLPWRMAGWDDLELYQQLIERSTGTLKSLTVETYGFGVKESDDYIFTSAKDYARLVQTLFDLQPASEVRSPMVLHDLTLGSQEFEHSGAAWVTPIDSTKLESIELCFYVDTDALLDALLPAFRHTPPRLQGLAYCYQDDGLATLQKLVKTFTGLRYVKLSHTGADGSTTGDIRCLEGHATTL